ncbi:MAG: type II toxin-antitoxin system RelB/DinJ family antitoxin [Fibromonadaceae bacterium]|jgi:DNA-damage-inducible protein J|nr:type II toxin-antitoxin system RelB/DinJ family antitoxin [Fibromonadaceae bacterium]
MSKSINVTIRLDRSVKEQAEDMFNSFGMNLSTAVNVFIRQALRLGKMPFSISDPFYSEKNQARLRESIEQYKAGKVVVKTMEELEAMENE